MQQVVQLHRHEAQLSEAGARLVIVGNGSPSFIDGLRERTGFTGPIYTDPERVVFASLSLKRSITSSIGLRTIGKAIAARRAGFKQAKTQGDPWQQGGVFAVDGDGSVLYAYRSSFAGDHPRINDIISALRQSSQPRNPASPSHGDAASYAAATSS